MNTANVCPLWDQLLPGDGPSCQCPACLLKAALPGQAAVTGLHDSASASAAEPGTHLKYFGDYELLEAIGQGGMGIVWKALA